MKLVRYARLRGLPYFFSTLLSFEHYCWPQIASFGVEWRLVAEVTLSIVCFSPDFSSLEFLLHPSCCDHTTEFRKPAVEAPQSKAHYSGFVRYSRCHLCWISKLGEQLFTLFCSFIDLTLYYDSVSLILALVQKEFGANAPEPQKSKPLVCFSNYGSPLLTSWGSFDVINQDSKLW